MPEKKHNDLKLVLKKQWYEMIASGIKNEEYRALTPYWKRILCAFNPDDDGCRCDRDCEACSKLFFMAKPFKTVTFYHGYAKDRPSMTFPMTAISIGRGKRHLGADPGNDCFIISFENKP